MAVYLPVHILVKNTECIHRITVAIEALSVKCQLALSAMDKCNIPPAFCEMYPFCILPILVRPPDRTTVFLTQTYCLTRKTSLVATFFSKRPPPLLDWPPHTRPPPPPHSPLLVPMVRVSKPLVIAGVCAVTAAALLVYALTRSSSSSVRLSVLLSVPLHSCIAFDQFRTFRPLFFEFW